MKMSIVSENLVSVEMNEGRPLFKVYGVVITQGAYMDHQSWATNPALVTTSVKEVATWCFNNPNYVEGAFAFST